MITVKIPSNVELRRVEQDKLPNLMKERPIFQILPVDTLDSHILEWEQEDNYVGLQQVRGLDGAPPRVKKVGGKRYLMEPGVYGEHMTITESEITQRRPWGQFSGPVSVDDLVMRRQDQLLGRRLDRIEQIGWTLLTTGTFSVAGPDGQVLHTDTFTLQTLAAAVSWATAATAVPLADFRAAQLLARGHSVDFGSGAKAYMNRVTWNNLIKNTNAADLGGKKGMGLESITSVADVNRILAGEGLPEIVIFDGGYLDESGTFQPFIANAKVVIVGKRTDGRPIGNYLMTRNAQNEGGAPGAYTLTADKASEVPRVIEVHDGHNGGPVIFFPSAIIILSV
jgi:hypothetical protein